MARQRPVQGPGRAGGKIGASVVGATLGAMLVAGCAGADSGETQAPPATSSAPAGEGWVVESNLYSRGSDGETWSVACILASELALDMTLRTRFREIETDKETSYAAEVGDPCPSGRILMEW